MKIMKKINMFLSEKLKGWREGGVEEVLKLKQGRVLTDFLFLF